MRLIDVDAADISRLEAAAGELARSLRPGDVVALRGDLGAGKTTFVRALVRALHGDDQASSPTFTFWHRYDGNPPINHLDLYRIEYPEELVELGLEEAFEDGSVVVIEWAERAAQRLPPHTVLVAIDGSGSQPRRIQAWRR